MDSDPPATTIMVLEKSTDSNVLSPTQQRQQLRLENVVNLLHQSLNPLLREMDASHTLDVGCQEWIHNANLQVTYLEDLTRLFQSQSHPMPRTTPGTTTYQANNNNDHNPFILMMMLNIWKSQIATVLRAVFYNNTTTETPPSLQATRGGETILSDVTQSKIRAIHRSAAICLRTLVQAVTTRPTSTAITHPPSVSDVGRFPHVKPCIMALLRGLATTANATATAKEELSNATTTTRKEPSSSSSWSTSSLDDPTITWIEIMITLHQLLQVYQEEEEETTLPTTRDLVVRLVGHVTTTMTWMMNRNATGSNNNNNNNNNNNSNRRTTTTTTTHAATIQLQIESVAVLIICMDKVRDAGLWQTMFPGTLASIYQCLVSCHRQTSTGRLVQLECSCLEFIRKLLLITLQPIQEGRCQERHHLVSTTSAMLQNLALVAQPPSIQGHDTEGKEAAAPDARGEQPRPSSDFLFNIHDKAVPHLIILLKQSSTLRSSPKIKMQAIQLARTLLIDTSLCWKECRYDVVESALECCLISHHQTRLLDGTIDLSC